MLKQKILTNYQRSSPCPIHPISCSSCPTSCGTTFSAATAPILSRRRTSTASPVTARATSAPTRSRPSACRRAPRWLTGRNAIRNGVTDNGAWLRPDLHASGIHTWPRIAQRGRLSHRRHRQNALLSVGHHPRLPISRRRRGQALDQRARRLLPASARARRTQIPRQRARGLLRGQGGDGQPPAAGAFARPLRGRRNVSLPAHLRQRCKW